MALPSSCFAEAEICRLEGRLLFSFTRGGRVSARPCTAVNQYSCVVFGKLKGLTEVLLIHSSSVVSTMSSWIGEVNCPP